METLTKTLAQKNQIKRIALKSGQNYKIFSLDQISTILATDHYSEVICHDQRILVDDSLDAIMKRMNAHHFLRVHRSAIINVNFLTELERQGDRKFKAILDDYFSTSVPISRESLPKLKLRLLLDH